MENKRVIEILIEECEACQERFPNYRKELIDAVTAILDYERQHSKQSTNIKQKISDQCDKLGKLLAKESASSLARR